jgi:hypothetical protein
MSRVAWRMLLPKPIRLPVTWSGLRILFFLTSLQMILLGECCENWMAQPSAIALARLL